MRLDQQINSTQPLCAADYDLNVTPYSAIAPLTASVSAPLMQRAANSRSPFAPRSRWAARITLDNERSVANPLIGIVVQKPVLCGPSLAGLEGGREAAPKGRDVTR